MKIYHVCEILSTDIFTSEVQGKGAECGICEECSAEMGLDDTGSLLKSHFYN